MKDEKSPGSSDAATRLAELRAGKKPLEPTEEAGFRISHAYKGRDTHGE